MPVRLRVIALVGFLIAFAIACTSLTRDTYLTPRAEPWQPEVQAARPVEGTSRPACRNADPLRQAFFGDLHIHTRHSMDARSRGMRSSPDDALRFARGETIGFGPFDREGRGSRNARLERPLDFAAITDHAEWIGEVDLCTKPGSPAYESRSCRAFRGERPIEDALPVPKFASAMTAVIGRDSRKREICGERDADCRAALRSVWLETQRVTERWNDTSERCTFTTFHGWEHSNSSDMSKIHRNVLFRNASVPELPISSLEAPAAVELFDRLDALCTNTQSGCEAITIPHNPNVSNGRLFHVDWKEQSRREQERRARQRLRLDRVVEMMQVKGESECRNGLYGVVGGADELCDFEKIRSFKQPVPVDCEEGTGAGALAGQGCQSRLDFARYALVEGFRENERIGVNPYRFGFIGSTDGHNANPGDVEEESYQGCCADNDALPAQRLATRPAFAGAGPVGRNPGGLVGVWSEENSRESLFEAIKRRETFATSGPRIEPRFFGGYALPSDLCARRDLVEQGYAAGVPMGGVLAPPERTGQSPVFVASVARDPGSEDRPGGRLDRLQIIKVWYGQDGQFHQRVHDVAGRRAPAGDAGRADRDESVEPVRVDLNTCLPERPMAGQDELCAVWRDPEFDATRDAAYYVRVVENPSCRWSWRTCLALPEADRPPACTDPEIPRTIQERAWTSPIWYEAQPSETTGES